MSALHLLKASCQQLRNPFSRRTLLVQLLKVVLYYLPGQAGCVDAYAAEKGVPAGNREEDHSSAPW